MSDSWDSLNCMSCGKVLSDHTKDELERCKLISEIVNIQKPVTKPEQRTHSTGKCDKCSLYISMGQANCSACGRKF